MDYRLFLRTISVFSPFFSQMSKKKCIFAAILKIIFMSTKSNSNEKKQDPWWVIALKILAYSIGLILAGVSTPAALVSCVNFVGGIF